MVGRTPGRQLFRRPRLHRLSSRSVPAGRGAAHAPAGLRLWLADVNPESVRRAGRPYSRLHPFPRQYSRDYRGAGAAGAGAGPRPRRRLPRHRPSPAAGRSADPDRVWARGWPAGLPCGRWRGTPQGRSPPCLCRSPPARLRRPAVARRGGRISRSRSAGAAGAIISPIRSATSKSSASRWPLHRLAAWLREAGQNCPVLTHRLVGPTRPGNAGRGGRHRRAREGKFGGGHLDPPAPCRSTQTSTHSVIELRPSRMMSV